MCARDLYPGSLKKADMAEYKCLGKDDLSQMKGKTERRISE